MKKHERPPVAYMFYETWLETIESVEKKYGELMAYRFYKIIMARLFDLKDFSEQDIPKEFEPILSGIAWQFDTIINTQLIRKAQKYINQRIVLLIGNDKVKGIIKEHLPSSETANQIIQQYALICDNFGIDKSSIEVFSSIMNEVNNATKKSIPYMFDATLFCDNMLKFIKKQSELLGNLKQLEVKVHLENSEQNEQAVLSDKIVEIEELIGKENENS